MTLPGDPGLNLITYLRSQLPIEPEWTVPLDRGFKWWPGHLAQRVWADPVCSVGTHTFSRVHFESDFVRDTVLNEKVVNLVALGNCFATFSSVCLTADGHIRLHASLCASDSSIDQGLGEFAKLILAVQAADADAKHSPEFVEVFDGAADVTSHPEMGPRQSGNVLLLALQHYVQLNGTCADPSEIDFQPLHDLEPRPWLMAFPGKGGLSAEMVFSDDISVVFHTVSDIPGPVGTALLRLDTDFAHPQFGKGILVRLKLPIYGSAADANALNQMEATNGALNADQVGGWCAQDQDIYFVTFVPAFLIERGRLSSLIYDNAIRSRWAARYFLAAGQQ